MTEADGRNIKKRDGLIDPYSCQTLPCFNKSYTCHVSLYLDR